MHAIVEIVIPPTEDIAAAVDKAMNRSKSWWDFYVVGGRFSGHKLESRLDPKKVEEFYAALSEKKVTVSSMQCGKQELAPASQIPMVDEMWQKMFPGFGEHCLFFNHSNNQYQHSFGTDVCKVSEMPENLTCCRLIIVGKTFSSLCTEHWNGKDFVKTKFDGKVMPVLKKKKIPGDWLVVTVDFHN